MHRALAIAVAASLVTACGMKGPLYLPKADAKSAQKSKSAGAASSAGTPGAAADSAAAPPATPASQ